MAYDVPPTARKMVLKSAGQKWREFKSRLSQNYVLPYSHERKLLEFPPADYSFIEKAHWDIFVADRLSDEFNVSFFLLCLFTTYLEGALGYLSC